MTAAIGAAPGGAAGEMLAAAPTGKARGPRGGAAFPQIAVGTEDGLTKGKPARSGTEQAEPLAVKAGDADAPVGDGVVIAAVSMPVEAVSAPPGFVPGAAIAVATPPVAGSPGEAGAEQVDTANVQPGGGLSATASADLAVGRPMAAAPGQPGPGGPPAVRLAEPAPATPTAKASTVLAEHPETSSGVHVSGVSAPKPIAAQVVAGRQGTALGQPESGGAGGNGSGGKEPPTVPRLGAAVRDASQSLPFRLETTPAGGAGPEGAGGGASEMADITPSSPDMAPPDAQPLPDVVVGLDSADRLDVMITTATREMADRVDAARDELVRDLGALGAEVEAIRVEVRPERGPDAPTDSSGGRREQGSATGRHDREGQAMQDNDRSMAARLLPPGEDSLRRVRPGADASQGRVDRYA